MKIAYYTVRRNGRGFWEPTKAMREAGFASVACGPDGPHAWSLAENWNRKWREHKLGADRPSCKKGFPARSLGEAFERYCRTSEWAKKSARTREEWERVWARIAPTFGDVSPRVLTLELVSAWRDQVEIAVSLREAHRCIKIWRALWRVARAMGYCDDDPSQGIRNVAAVPRQKAWREGEVVRLAKVAWRARYRGLAVIIAIAWDTQFSPADVRGLACQHAIAGPAGFGFALGRAKTGRAALGTLTRRAQLLVLAYVARLDFDLHDAAPIFRNRSGAPYSKDTLGDDFRDVREIVFGPKECRTLADFRRSGTIEAFAGDADAATVSAKMANTLSASNALHRTYAPVEISKVQAADAARRKGRQKLRG